MTRDKIYNQIISRDLLNRDILDFFLGEHLGGGAFRQVFDCENNPGWVIKIDLGDEYCNVMEYKIWQAVYNTPQAKWFAPIKWISSCGKVLMMKKCKPLKVYPKKVPAYFTDLHYGNWMSLNGKPVCVDYANNLIIENGTSVGMRVANFKTDGTTPK